MPDRLDVVVVAVEKEDRSSAAGLTLTLSFVESDRLLEEATQQIFLFEIKTQCELISVAHAQLAEAENDLASLDYGDRLDELKEVQKTIQRLIAIQWAALQTIAVSAANLSKMLWGSGGRRSTRRAPLRRRLKVEDDSLLRSPDLRNDFEHFDERIEASFQGDRVALYVGRNIGPLASFRVDGEPTQRRFGHYDPTTGELSFWANSMNVPGVVVEAKRLADLSEEEALKSSWVE